MTDSSIFPCFDGDGPHDIAYAGDDERSVRIDYTSMLFRWASGHAT